MALYLLCFVLLLTINGNGSTARDMKLQQEHVEEKQVNQAYLDGWLKDTQDQTKKTTHNSKQTYLDGWLKDTQKSTQNFNQAYLDGWLKDTQKPKQAYLDGWLKDTQKPNHNSKQAYLDGWLKDTQKSTPNSNQAYLDGWLKDTQKPKQAYLDGWLKDTQKPTHTSKQAYLDGWLKDTQKSTQNSNHAYLDGWLKDTQKPKQAYLDGWLKDTQKPTHTSKQAYLDGWLKDTQKSTQNSNHAYLDGWLKDTQKPKQAYLDGWLKDTQKPNHNSKQAYLDGWLKDTQKPTQNSNQAYLDGWLKDSLPANKKIGQDLAESKGKLSSNVDRTEAHKSACFTLDDLYVGNVMTLQFPVREYANFLPRKLADSIPFSKPQLPSLLQLFSLTEDSPQGEDMKDIIDQCEFEPTKGETKACPTSLESMLEFVRSVLGAEAKYNIHTTSYPTTSGARLQNYTVLKISKDIYAPKWVACHPRPYPYALYYCHYLDIGSKVFRVLLGGEYGDTMDALGICHLDTSDMNPDHVIIQQLGIKPGEDPLCHFFPVKHLLWVPLPPEANK